MLILGPEGSGKSTLLYSKKLPEDILRNNPMKPSRGFQYEELNESESSKNVAGFWDVGGDEACQQAMSAIIQGVRFQAIIYVIDVSSEVVSVEGGTRAAAKSKGAAAATPGSTHTQIDHARRQIHQLMCEEELRDVHTLAIVLNCREPEDKSEQGPKTLWKEVYAERQDKHFLYE